MKFLFCQAIDLELKNSLFFKTLSQCSYQLIYISLFYYPSFRIVPHLSSSQLKPSLIFLLPVLNTFYVFPFTYKPLYTTRVMVTCFSSWFFSHQPITFQVNLPGLSASHPPWSSLCWLQNTQTPANEQRRYIWYGSGRPACKYSPIPIRRINPNISFAFSQHDRKYNLLRKVVYSMTCWENLWLVERTCELPFIASWNSFRTYCLSWRR